VLLDVPTHTIVRWLAPAIQQDYGTEYATIVFSRVLNVPVLAALVTTALGLIVFVFQRPPTSIADTEGS
jgi:hypothetical protein